jgi:hypothetical protein
VARQLEAIEEVKFYNWVRRKPAIAPYIFKICNEGKRSPQYGMQLKRQGMRAGVLDNFCMIARGDYHGLWLEFKIKPNPLTKAQKEFAENAKEQGYKVVVVYSADEAIKELESYLS